MNTKIKPKPEPELPLIPVIRTISGGKMKMSSLRPGDWLGYERPTCVVLQSSARLCRMEVRWNDGVSQSRAWDTFSLLEFRGAGRKRRWHALLPAWLKRKVCPYSKP